MFGVGLLARVAAERGHSERAGRLWGAIEDDDALAPLGGWLRHRESVRGTDPATQPARVRPRLRRGPRLQRSTTLSRWPWTTASVSILTTPHVLIHEKLDQATRDPARAGRRPLAHARPRDAAHEGPVPRPHRRHVLRLAERVPRRGERRAHRRRRPLRRADPPRARRLQRGGRLRREPLPSPAGGDRTARPALDRPQLLGLRPRRRRPHARPLADAAGNARRHGVRRPPGLVRGDRQRPARAEVGGGSAPHPGSRRGHGGDLRARHGDARAGPVRARDRRRHARRGGEARPRLRLGRGPLPGGERRPGQGRRPLLAERASPRSEASCCMSTSASRATTTRAISSGSGTPSTRANRNRPPTSLARGTRSGRPSTPASPS